MSRTSESAARETLGRSLADAMPTLLPPFLAGQRWFAGKGRALRAATLEDLVWLPAAGPAALGVVAVNYDEGPSERYLMLLGWAAEPHPGVTIGRLEGVPGRPWLIEGCGQRETVTALLRGLCTPATLPTAAGGGLVYADVDPAGSEGLAAETLDRGEAKLLGAEQSNTTLRVGRAHTFKLFRRLEPGENPEVEMTRFLTRSAAFDGCPALRGSVAYRRADVPAGTVGVLEDWVENEGDGWSRALRQLARGGTADGVPTLLRDLAALGRVTAGFHVALASSDRDPDFAPAPFTEADGDDCAASLRERVQRLAARLRGARGGLSPAIEAAVDRFLAAGTALAAWTPPPIGAPGDRFHRIRIHGDYHLGQTLKTPESYVVIDLEGEPAAPRAERRRKHPALRDVAGMLRSFDYAASSTGAPDERAARVEAMRSAFLAAYREGIGAARVPVVPADAEARERWTRFFELSKALYEAEYELDNRPEWLGIPLGGIERLLTPPGDGARRP